MIDSANNAIRQHLLGLQRIAVNNFFILCDQNISIFILAYQAKILWAT